MIESWVGASGNLLPPLLKSKGHTYTFITRKPEHYQSSMSVETHPVIHHAEEVLVTETNNVKSLIEFLRPYHFDGVITVCDYYIEIVREVADAFHLPHPFPSQVENVRKKHLMRQAFDLAQLENPLYKLAYEWENVKKAASDIGYPLVLKPVDLASSAFVSLIQNETDLKEAYKKLEAFPLNFRDQPRERVYLLEEYITGQEVSVESVTYQGETTILGITDKSITGTPYFIEDGHMFPAQLEEKVTQEVIEFVQRALQAVKFDNGIAHTEVMLTTEGPRIIEINPRTAGNYIVELINRVKGIDLLNIFAELAIGQKPNLTSSKTLVSSAAVKFLVPPKAGTITEVEGINELETNENIARYVMGNVKGKFVASPIDNACYLGHVIAEDSDGLKARSFAEAAIRRILLKYETDNQVEV